MSTVINFLSVIPMRKEPAHQSEMVSQLLFGEFAQILEKQEYFVKIQCLYDGYEGWVQANQLTITEETFATETYIGNWSREIAVNGRIIHAPMCSPVYLKKEGAIYIGKTEVRHFEMDDECYWNSTEKKFTKSNLESVYQKYLDTPYLWGGKSVFGIDCSGFAQQVFKMFGVHLFRDAYLQAEQGTSIKNIADVSLGDLAFFHNDKGRIVHVGILLGNNQIVHASGKVRIDAIDDRGIINRETTQRTHQLHSIKRVL